MVLNLYVAHLKQLAMVDESISPSTLLDSSEDYSDGLAAEDSNSDVEEELDPLFHWIVEVQN